MSTSRKGKVVVLGATGTVGSALVRELASAFDVHATGYQRAVGGVTSLDLRDPQATSDYLRGMDPDTVVLCSAVSNVAACEAEPEAARALNVDAVATVAEACRNRRLVFFSSDAVFSDAKEVWSEDDEPDPPSVYGRQKAEAEEIVRELCADHLIVRTARVYARQRGDGKFIDFVIRTLRDGGEISAPRDTPGNPTLLDDLTSGVARLLAEERSGTWHVTGPPVGSLYETALAVAEILNADLSRVRAIERDEGSDLPRITAVLDTSKAEEVGLELRDLATGLASLEL